MAAVTYAAVLATLIICHNVGDHWVQTDAQAREKGTGGVHGALASLRHTLTLTATLAAGLAVVAWRTGLHLDVGHVAVGLAVNAVTHWWVDLRWPIRKMAGALGMKEWLKTDPQAPYLLDQSWHMLWLMVAALFIA